jgi:hypothetical protein
MRGLVVGLVACGCLLLCASAAEARLVFKRPSGSEIKFSGTPRVWCGPWGESSARRSVHLELRTPKRGWELIAVQRDVESGRRIRFPGDVISNRPHGALLFAFQAKPLIEASSNEEEASGWMAFTQSSCEIGGTVAFKIHAVLGSELFEGTRVRVNGTFEGQVGEAPPPMSFARSAG